jgi:hypothetical protein
MNLIDILFSRALMEPFLVDWIQKMTEEKADAASVPASADLNAAGLAAFRNSGGAQLFTLQLPLYTGGVE